MQEDLDIVLSVRIAEKADIEKSIVEFHVILKIACNKTYRKHRTSKKTTQIISMVDRGTDYTAEKNKRPQTETSENEK